MNAELQGDLVLVKNLIKFIYFIIIYYYYQKPFFLFYWKLEFQSWDESPANTTKTISRGGPEYWPILKYTNIGKKVFYNILKNVILYKVILKTF